MKLSLDRHRLADALKVTGAMGRQSELPIFSCALLSPEDDGVSITTSNLETQVTASIPCDDQKDVSPVAVSHRSLLTFVGSSKSDWIEVSVGGNGLLLDDGTAKAILPIRDAKDFDLMREDAFEVCASGPHDRIAKALDWAMKAAIGCELDRLAMRCVCLDGGKAYASNGKLMHIADTGYQIKATMERESMRPISLTLSHGEESTWSTTNSMLRIVCGSVKTIVRQADVVWPINAVQHILGDCEDTIEWKCSTESLVNGIKRVLQIAPNDFSRVTVKGEMVTSENKAGERATMLLDGEVGGNVSFSGPMMIDLVSNAGGVLVSNERKIRYEVNGDIGMLAAMLESRP